MHFTVKNGRGQGGIDNAKLMLIFDFVNIYSFQRLVLSVCVVQGMSKILVSRPSGKQDGKSCHFLGIGGIEVIRTFDQDFFTLHYILLSNLSKNIQS